MATAALAIGRPASTPLTLWHLLSLDAPTIAILWTVFAARASHTRLPPALAPAMFLAVWLLYATDRLLDTHPLTTSPWLSRLFAPFDYAAPSATPTRHLQPRHRFHQTHRVPFTLAIVIAASVLALLVPSLPSALLRPYLVLAALLALWFALIHLTSLSLPKEFAPGLFFAVAVFIPIPHALPAAVLFAALCTLNCLYIHHWEHPSTSPDLALRVPHPHEGSRVIRVGRGPVAPAHHPTAPFDAPTATCSHPATSWALSYLPQLTLAVALLPLTHPDPVSSAISLSAFALFSLNHNRHHLSPTTLRAAADLALLTPLLVLPFLP